METHVLKRVLSAAIDAATFEFESVGIDSDDRTRREARQSMSATQFRDAYLRERDRPGKMYANPSVPEAAMTPLVDALESTLGEFICSDTDTIGHAFPVDGSNYHRGTFRPDGLFDDEYQSTVRVFTHALIRAAAVTGVETVAGRLADWIGGEAVRLRMCTVLSGLPLVAPVTLQEDIRIVPLALTTAELPRLPIRRETALQDYLGLSLLTMQLSATPALFRPDPNTEEGTVRTSSVDCVNLDLICQALSLQANDLVSASSVWHEFPDAAPFYLGEPSTWGTSGENRLRPRKRKSLSHDFQTGETTLTPAEDKPPHRLDDGNLWRIIEALCRSEKKLRIAVDRWRRSKRPEARLEDQYIDLRVALEALYLKDFDDERNQEMRFRLALFGAWHLANGLDERRSVRKALRDAYDMASKAVHGGNVLNEERADLYHEATAELARAQDLCRRGILKLLLEGPPNDWGDLVLGAPAS